MTVTLNKKHFITAIITVIVISICILSYKNYVLSRYENAAKDMKINASINLSVLTEVLSDINNAWNTGISGGNIQNADGESVYVNDMNQAIQLRLTAWNAKGIYDIIDSLAKETTKDMEVMSNSPSKYESIQKTYIEIYNNLNELISLSKNPQYSLLAFSQKVNDLTMNTNSKIKETDLQVKVSDEEMQKRESSVIKAIFQKEKDIIEMKQKIERRKLAYQINKERSFLVQNAKKPGVKTLPSGLQYRIIKNGTGDIPKATSLVTCNYEGRTIDGKVFDSSYKRNMPITLRANQVMKGWEEALTHMPAGSIWEVYIPQSLGYGNREQGSIKPYSTLIFKIQLISVE